jgi:hypothetical protein
MVTSLTVDGAALVRSGTLLGDSGSRVFAVQPSSACRCSRKQHVCLLSIGMPGFFQTSCQPESGVLCLQNQYLTDWLSWPRGTPRESLVELIKVAGRIDQRLAKLARHVLQEERE